MSARIDVNIACSMQPQPSGYDSAPAYTEEQTVADKHWHSHLQKAAS